MADSNNVAKKLKDEIDSGFELFREYKKVSDKFVSDMNKEINKIGLKLDKNTSLTERKKKVMKYLEKLDKDFRNFGINKSLKLFNPIKKYDAFSRPLHIVDANGKKKERYDLYINVLEIIKNMISYEKSFIKYKKEQRAKKTKILRNIHKLQGLLSENKSSDKEFNKIYSKKLKIGTKTYTLKHLLGHLEAGEITDSVNDMNVNTYKKLQFFLNRQEKLVNKIKLKRESQKDKKNIFRETEKLFNIKQAIIKIYEHVLKGANIPPKIENVIKILDKQKLTGKEGEKYKELKENYKKIVKEIERLKKESKVSNVSDSSSSNKASSADSNTSNADSDTSSSNNGFQEPKNNLRKQKKRKEKRIKELKDEIEAIDKEFKQFENENIVYNHLLEEFEKALQKSILSFYEKKMKFQGLQENEIIGKNGNDYYFLIDGIEKLLNLKREIPQLQTWIESRRKIKTDLLNKLEELGDAIESKQLRMFKIKKELKELENSK